MIQPQKSRPAPRSPLGVRHAAAFTLIELMVVISIIAVLIGIMLPALGSARHSAHAIRCAGNMRQLAVGFGMYADQHSGQCIPGRMAKEGDASDPRNHYDVGNGLHYRPRWMVTMGAGAGFHAYAQPSTDPGKENDNNRLLEHEIFVDPTVPDWINNRNYALGYNFQFLGNSRRGTSGGFVNFPVNLYQIQAATVLFADTLGTAATFTEASRLPYNPMPHPDKDARELANHGWSLDPPRLTAISDNCDGGRDGQTRSAVHERHLGKANVAWIDGHVEAMTAEQLGYARHQNGAFAYEHAEASNRLFSGTGRDTDPPPVN